MEKLLLQVYFESEYLDETIRDLQPYADKDDGILYIEYC
jgi:hypothetical protein